MPPLRTRLATLLAVPRQRDARVFAVASVVDALGNGLFLPISALFFVKVVGLSTTSVGVGLSVAGTAAMLAPVGSGPPVDRFGARRVGVVLYVVRGLGYAAYPLVDTYWAFLALATTMAVADNMARPAMQALVATLTDEADRVTTLAFVRSVRNVGYAAGGLLVSGALAIGGRGPYVVLVLGNAVSFAVAAVLLLRVRDTHARLAAGPRAGYRVVLRDRRFMALTACNGVLILHLSVLLFGFPLWIDQRTAAPTWVAGVIFTLNSALVVLLQVPFSRRAATVRQGGRALRKGGFALAATCVLLALTPGLPPWPAVALLLVIGAVEVCAEVWQSAGSWAVSLGLAPEHARGRYLGVFALAFSVHAIAGPTLMALIVEDLGRPGWLALGAVVAVAGVVAARLAHDASPAEPSADTA